MADALNVVNAPKNSTFQMRVNPDIRKAVEEIYAKSGMTLTDAINAFFQQTLNVNGLPFLITPDSRAALHQQAVFRLMQELEKGERSAKTEADLLDEGDIAKEFGIAL